MFAGCIALAIAGMTLCYSGDKITCSDISQGQFETCKAQAEKLRIQMEVAKQLGICSADGSTCSGQLPSVWYSSPR